MGLFDTKSELQKYVEKINQTTSMSLDIQAIEKYRENISENDLIKIVNKTIFLLGKLTIF